VLPSQHLTPAIGEIARSTAAPVPAGKAACYSLFGRRVLSEIPLPVPRETQRIPGASDWYFRRMPEGAVPPTPNAPIVALTRCEHGRTVASLREGPSGAWLWNLAIATCFVHAEAAVQRTVDVYPEVGAAEGDLALMLMGPVAALLLHRAGLPILHASAAVPSTGAHERAAIALLGPKGRGKSTMAASLARRGGALLTDDLLPLQAGADGAVVGLPGIPLIKAWDSTIEHVFGRATSFPRVTAGLDKRLIELDGRLPFQAEPLPIGAIFVLERDEAPAGSDAAVQRLDGRDAIVALLQHTAYPDFLTPTRAAALLPLYAQLARQARMFVLRYPSGFTHLPHVCARILNAVAAG
jgi:hypothetical protein